MNNAPNTIRLELKQSQSLIMTQQLQQAIKLLQMSSVELSDYVEKELEENPMLSREDDVLESFDDDFGGELSGGADDGFGSENLNSDKNDFDEYGPEDIPSAAEVSEVDNHYADDAGYDGVSENYEGDSAVYENEFSSIESLDSLGNGSGIGSFSNDLGGAGSGSIGGGDAFSPPSDATFILEQTVSAEPTLKEQILEQINLDIKDEVDRGIARYLTDMLDDAGYLSCDLDEIAVALGCSVKQIQNVLLQLHGMEPVGVFARDLKECLSIQLKDKGKYTAFMEVLLDNLKLIADLEFKKLARTCGVSMDELQCMVKEIRSLDPKPAFAFGGAISQPITNDVFVIPDGKGGWRVQLNNDALPRVLLNNDYYSLIKKSIKNKDERKFVNERMQSASWLVKSLHQRATTILKVATEIVSQQEEFLNKGIEYLRPLVLRDIAEEIEMHESTVSRVTTHKYMVTPRGTFELKYFFSQAISSAIGIDGSSVSSAIGTANNDAVLSAEAVKYKVKVIIDGEPENTALSDDKIAAMLQEEGVNIARRTVAKYREALGIPTSAKRKRIKKAKALDMAV
ncbi:MAG: RNA polymerase factor sigma-54 [Alphaproteobacteria bacterium]|nr:RNA polymerase factor sigma-54 [Alphaproteobacteria bacterium]